MTLNRYGTLAQEHMRTYLPARYGQIEDPDTYFTELGEQIAAQVHALEITLAAAEPAAEDYLARAGQLRAARMQAEEIVFSDLVWLPAETDPDDPEAERDETGAYIGWTDPVKQAIWAPGPDLEDWELDEYHAGRDPATGRPLLSDEEIEQRVAEQNRRQACGSPADSPNS